jgi:hypothetical protein
MSKETLAKDLDLSKNNTDEIIFNRFIKDSCIIDELEYISIRELVYQYKTWSKINNVFNYKNFEQYLLTKFKTKRMMNNIFNSEMCCLLGIKLKDSFYKFDFAEPFNEFEKFITENCVKIPTAKLNRTTIKDTYEKWCITNGNTKPNKLKIVNLCKFLDKYFFKNKFYEGDSTYIGWYGITIKENILKGTGLTSTLCKKVKISLIYKDNPSCIIKTWDSQKAASAELCIITSTLKYRLDNKCIFKYNDKECYLIRD